MVLGVLYAIVFVLLVGRGFEEAKHQVDTERAHAEQMRDEAVKQADEARSKVEAAAREVGESANRSRRRSARSTRRRPTRIATPPRSASPSCTSN